MESAKNFPRSLVKFQTVASSIQASTSVQEDKVDSLEQVRGSSEQFIEDTYRIDGNVAELVNKRKDDFYDQYKYLKPDSKKNLLEEIKDRLKKGWEWCKEHWKGIVTVLLVIAAIAVIVVALVTTIAVPALLVAMAIEALIGAALGGVIGGIFSVITGGSFWEGFKEGAFYGAIGGAMSFVFTGVVWGGILTLKQLLLIGGVSAIGSVWVGDLGDIVLKGVKMSLKEIVIDVVVAGVTGVVFAGIAYGLSKAFKALKLKMFNKGGSETKNLIDNMDEIAEDIVNINKKYSDGYQVNNSIESILNSASYYDDPYEQAAAVTRSITDHAFANGNKRTAFDTLNMLIDDLKLNNSLSDTQKWDLIYDIAEGRVNDVTEIANIIKGK